jgi:hypothetical protein
MRRRTWIASALVMIIMAGAVVALITTGARWLLDARHAPPTPAQSGPLPKALADEIKRNEHAYYLRGINDAVEFWRLTGVVPDTPALRDALWARQQIAHQPLTAAEAYTMLRHATAPRTP